jgi:hypothetical protein
MKPQQKASQAQSFHKPVIIFIFFSSNLINDASVDENM